MWNFNFFFHHRKKSALYVRRHFNAKTEKKNELMQMKFYISTLPPKSAMRVELKWII